MTDNEIIKALECCLSSKEYIACFSCPAVKYDICCNGSAKISNGVADKVVDLIKRQQANISVLEKEKEVLVEAYNIEKEKVEKAKQKLITTFKMRETEKSKTIKEFAERLKNMHRHNTTSVVSLVTVFDNINKLVEEMVGEHK